MNMNIDNIKIDQSMPYSISGWKYLKRVPPTLTLIVHGPLVDMTGYSLPSVERVTFNLAIFSSNSLICSKPIYIEYRVRFPFLASSSFFFFSSSSFFFSSSGDNLVSPPKHPQQPPAPNTPLF